MLYPLVWMVATSFKPADEIISQPRSCCPSHLEWANYATAAGRHRRRHRLGGFSCNSLLIAVGAVVGNVLVLLAGRVRLRPAAVPAARAAVRPHDRHAAAAAPRADPAVHPVQPARLVDTYWPLIVPKFLATEAFFVFLMVQFMRGHPARAGRGGADRRLRALPHLLSASSCR